MTIPTSPYRLLIVDDNESIHDDLKKILLPRTFDSGMAADEALLFGTTAETGVVFEISSALQGQEGLECVVRAKASGQPFALAFVDVRMPPGWDGIETISHLWTVDPDLQIVICTAHSDYNWKDISERLGVSANFVILKKPFDIIEVTQLAHAMTTKWTSMHQARLRMEELDRLVEERTAKLSAANAQLKLLEAALEATASSITITDDKGIVVWTNPAFSALSGYSAEEVIGTNRSTLKSGMHNEEFYKEMWSAISSGRVWRGEVVNRRKDGSLSPEEMTITPVVSKLGSLTHFIAINQDITERKRAEAALREAEEKYRAIFEDAVVGIFQGTPDGRLLNVNRAFATMHGYESPEEVLAKVSGKGGLPFIHPAQLKEWTRLLEEHGVVRSTEIEVTCKDGSHKWVLVNIRAVRNADGQVVLHDGTIEDVTERKLAQQQVNYLAYYDALTGLPNRMLLHDRLNNALAAAVRRGTSAALLFLDLDRFKIINDSLGHSFGDLLLQQLANRLKDEIRQNDTVARVGGDEFLIVLASVESMAEVEAIATRIVNSVTGQFVIEGHSLTVTCSLGISMFPTHGKDGETLIKNADAAMYAAKEQGCNTHCFFTDEMNTLVTERLTLENSLRLSIERNELFLVYQPQVNIASGRVIGLEALVRWQHPEWGLVMPDRFIRVAENCGLITAIGEWVLRTACYQTKSWQNEGIIVVPVAVNVSAAQFRQEGFRELIKQVLRETGLDPQYLELELTESLLLTNADVMFDVLQELTEMGLRLVIDDFGTGYSSLSYLRHFPVTKLKIDRSFIRDVAVNPDDAAITTAIINMSKSLNLKVIAEGVENEAQLSFLREHQCDEFQGYYFSRPLKSFDVAAKLWKREMSNQEETEATFGVERHCAITHTS
jgi:diguanylate cyclase (GGDEF)-like protein/PAS domain S-box-containing protein